jgi:hypothetical protein
MLGLHKKAQMGTMAADTYHHSKKNLFWIILLLTALLGVFAFAVLYGEGFDQDSNDPFWAIVVGSSLFACIAAFGWALWRNPRAIVVSDMGIDIPLAFKRPLRWDEIHRIRRVRLRGAFYGRRDWLIVELLPGVLAPLRLPIWRRLEFWLQEQHGVRIPLHGLEGDADEIVRSVERYRPVKAESD